MWREFSDKSTLISRVTNYQSRIILGPSIMSHKKSADYYDVYLKEPIVTQNLFRHRTTDLTPVPEFSSIRELLPSPFWDGHEDSINCWWKAWELAFSNIRPASSATGFIAPFIDSAFNDCLFMWDSAFILQFAKYGLKAFDFQRTLDNFYCRQHDDGFICREIKEWDGGDRFHRFDPASTGPNVLGFAEWEYYNFTKDTDRLSLVFPVLLGYHRWIRKYRTWPDKSYWTTGWACGMDNQPRTSCSDEWIYYHDHQTWVDANFQALLSAQILVMIAGVLNINIDKFQDILDEEQFLSNYVNTYLWDGFYKDRSPGGVLSSVLTIGAFWCLHTNNIPKVRLDSMVNALKDPDLFNRPHRVPSLAASSPHYKRNGGYWQGSVWPSTNYMIISGLEASGFHEEARDIAFNHYNAVLDVFNTTGTFWENYAPEDFSPGSKAKKDFVGWSGLGPIALFLEFIIGLHPDVLTNILRWDIYLTEQHGVKNYPFGKEGIMNLECKSRSSILDRPVVKITSNIPVTVYLSWPGGTDIIHTNKE
jgi:glycogen debranching enzyme